MIVNQQDVIVVSIMNSFLIFSVNTFVIISGYFSIKPSISKVLKIIIPLALYTILFTTIPHFFEHNYRASIYSLFFLSRGPYWFILDYLFLMAFAPFLNIGYEKLNQKKSTLIILCLFVINCYFGFWCGNVVNNNGYTLMQFVFMYIIGRHIRLYGINIGKSVSVLIYVVCSLIIGTLFCYHFNNGEGSKAWSLTFYNNPLIIISAVMFFRFFLSLEFKSRIVNLLSSSALSIYLIQNTYIVSDCYYSIVADTYKSFQNVYITIAIAALISVFVCLSSILIDKITKPLQDFIVVKVQTISPNIWK